MMYFIYNTEGIKRECFLKFSLSSGFFISRKKIRFIRTLSLLSFMNLSGLIFSKIGFIRIFLTILNDIILGLR